MPISGCPANGSSASVVKIWTRRVVELGEDGG